MPYDELNNQKVIVTGIVSAALVFVVIVGAQAFYYRMQRAEYERKVVAVQPEQLRQVQAQQEAQLHGYRWVDPKEKIAAIDIDRAMELVARDLSKDEAKSGGTQP